MSSMAKIFVVVNLFLGLVAFGSAATLLGATDDYRAAYEKEVDAHSATKQTSANEIKRLELTTMQATQKSAEQTGRADDLQNEIGSLKTTLASAEATNQALRSSVESFAKQLGEQKDLIAANQAFLEKLSGDKNTATEQMVNAKANFDKEVANRIGLEQQVSELNEQMESLRASKGDVDRALVEANFYLEAYRRKFGPLDPVQGAPGVVNAVRGDLVGISVGSADKVRVGDFYSLSRGAAFVGRIKITSVDRNQSVGEFDPQFAGKGAPPQVGDKATPGGMQ